MTIQPIFDATARAGKRGTQSLQSIPTGPVSRQTGRFRVLAWL